MFKLSGKYSLDHLELREHFTGILIEFFSLLYFPFFIPLIQLFSPILYFTFLFTLLNPFQDPSCHSLSLRLPLSSLHPYSLLCSPSSHFLSFGKSNFITLKIRQMSSVQRYYPKPHVVLLVRTSHRHSTRNAHIFRIFFLGLHDYVLMLRGILSFKLQRLLVE